MSSVTSQSPVTLELTGPLQRLVGDAPVELGVGPASNVGELLAALVDRFPAAAEHLATAEQLRRGEGTMPAGFLLIRGGAAVAASLTTPVTAGERLTLLSVISGG